MSFQTLKTFVHLRNTNEDILDEKRELSDPAYKATQPKYSQTQKRSKDIYKTVHVTSVTQLKVHKAIVLKYFSSTKKTIITIYLTILLPVLPSSAILESAMRHPYAFPRT